MRYCVLFCSLLSILCLNVFGAFAEESKGFYHERKGGFYWYEDDPASESDPEAEQQLYEMPPPDTYSYQDLWKMHPEKRAEIMETRKLILIQEPTIENALRFLESQDIAQRKATAVAGVTAAASQMNPKFKGLHLTTMTPPAKRVYHQAKSENIDSILDSGAEEFALVVFETAGCQYCDIQRPVIDRFEATHGWIVKHVDIDEYRQLADRYGIEITPSVLMLVRDSNNAVPISTGVVTMPDLRERIMRAIRYVRGEIEPPQWFNNGNGSDNGKDPLKFVSQGNE
jgi:conjugal transfer pilus assembly protein TraF